LVNQFQFNHHVHRYFLYSESLEIVRQLNEGIVPVDKHARMQDMMDQFVQFYEKGWEYLKALEAQNEKEDIKHALIGENTEANLRERRKFESLSKEE
jgi:hypothetical protein